MELQVLGRTVRATTGGRELDRSLPLLVFVHGAGNDRTVWQLQTRYFSHHAWAVVAPDLPGHGGSDGPPPATIADYAGWLEALITALGWEQASLCGHSMGSFISLELAAHAPDRVRRLALVGTATAMPVHPDLQNAADHDDHLAYDLITGWTHSPQARIGGNQTPGIWMAGASMRLLERNQPGVLANDLNACASYGGALDAARRVRAPVLLMLGTQDLMTRPRGAEPFQDALANCRTVMLEGAGHSMMIENPDGVIDGLAAFLSES